MLLLNLLNCTICYKAKGVFYYFKNPIHSAVIIIIVLHVKIPKKSKHFLLPLQNS